MPEWKALVRERLSVPLPSAAVREEVIAEIAAHLDDLYEAQLAAGISEAHALERALAEMNDPRLVTNIERAEQTDGLMNSRSKQFWLPALLSLTASMMWLMVLQLAGTKIDTPWKYSGVPIAPYALWIVTLPLIGAASGRISGRAGSTRSARFAAAVFPSLVMATLWLLILASLLLRGRPYPFQAIAFFSGFFLWVILPGAALLAGTLPRWKNTPSAT